MDIEQVELIHGDALDLSKIALKILRCNSLWIMNHDSDFFNIAVTDKAILQHYSDKRFYLEDPSIHAATDYNDSVFRIVLGTDCDEFKNNHFFYDLYKMFNVTEFVSIQTKIQEVHYCFRFFTQNNRFIFMDQLLKNKPIITMAISKLIEAFHREANDNRKSFRLSTLRMP